MLEINGDNKFSYSVPIQMCLFLLVILHRKRVKNISFTTLYSDVIDTHGRLCKCTRSARLNVMRTAYIS